jgi:hypothetical protein
MRRREGGGKEDSAVRSVDLRFGVFVFMPTRDQVGV